MSWILVPSLTELEADNLGELNIQYLPGTLKDFSQWLSATFPEILSPNDVAIARNPSLISLAKASGVEKKDRLVTIFEHVKPVNRANLQVGFIDASYRGRVRDFYKGFKPTWVDIVEGIPAELEITGKFLQKCIDAVESDKKVLLACGPAGSGKTTLLKQVALKLSDTIPIPVYFIMEPVKCFVDIIKELESTVEGRYFVFYDRVSDLMAEVCEVLDSKLLNKGIFVSAESLRVWEKRVKERLKIYCASPLKISEITKTDALNILDGIKTYGPWTRLSSLTQKKRLEELLDNSKRQLLIGMLETTYGQGFEQIIENDYTQIIDDEERFFLIVISLATANKLRIDSSFVSRALDFLGYDVDIDGLAGKLSGIVVRKGDKFEARHPIYARQLIESIVTKDHLMESIKALIQSYTVYEAPVIRSVSREESLLFRRVINHRFLRSILRDDFSSIVSIYESFEKYFESDGLYWLQYGLVLRDMGLHAEAYEKISTACITHKHPHTEHALAQQELLLALDTELIEKASALFSSAKNRLETLDKRVYDDFYPIVTLAEGHVQFSRKFDGIDAAKNIAKTYANIIQQKLRYAHDDYMMKNCWKRLTNFATQGFWQEREGEYEAW